MKAVLVSSLSDDFSGVELTEVPMPRRKGGEVLVRIRAAALNFPDLLMTRGAYQFKPDLPFVLGMEWAGEVVEADPSSDFAPGHRVSGSAKTGAFAEYACLPAHALRSVPEGLTFAQAASLGAAYTTAWTGLMELGRLEAGQWVFVTGASGGVGLAACDLARAMGARVIAGTGVAEKIDAIRGAVSPDAVVLTEGRFREQVREITEGALCDIVFDLVGGDVFDECTRCVAFGGQLQVVGFTSGRIAEIATNIPLIKGFSVVGLRAGEYARRRPDRGRAIAESVHRLAEAGRIAPIIDRALPLERWREGLAAMANRELVGKVVFEPRP